MKKVKVVLLVVLMALLLAACAGKADSGAKLSKEDFVGEWVHYDDYAVQNITIQADGTYLTQTEASMGFTMSSTYSWSYENGVFAVDYGELGVSKYSKVTLKDGVLTLDNGVGQMVLQKK